MATPLNKSRDQVGQLVVTEDGGINLGSALNIQDLKDRKPVEGVCTMPVAS